MLEKLQEQYDVLLDNNHRHPKRLIVHFDTWKEVEEQIKEYHNITGASASKIKINEILGMRIFRSSDAELGEFIIS